VIRVATVGVGGMARNYRSNYANLPGVEWTLAVDVSEPELEACRAQGCVRTSSRFEDALDAGIDVVDISTPNFLHESQATAALGAGKHVLLQKPMANSLSAADAIVHAASGAKGILGMYMSSYANPMVWEIKKLIDSGALGQIQSVRARDAHRGGLGAMPLATNWRSSREKTGGGSFIQLSIHAINLIQWWLGKRISEVTAYSQNMYCPNIGGDDVTTAIVRFGDSPAPMGTFDSGYASDHQTREIYGTQGWLNLTDYDRAVEVKLDAPYASPLIQYTTPGKTARFECPDVKLDDTTSPYNPQRMFIEAVREGKRPHMTGPDGRQDLAVVMAVYESAEKGMPVKVR